jgi:stringent starvation protein B
LEAKTKRQVFEAMREKAVAPGHVQIALDARVPGVKVPLVFADQYDLRLNFARWAGKGDLRVDDWGVRETLCFNGVWTEVSVPWPAVFGIFAQGSLPELFGDSVPSDVLKNARELLNQELEHREANQEPPKPKLRLVK